MRKDIEKLLENPGLKLAEEIAACLAKEAGITFAEGAGLRNPQSDPNSGFSPELIRRLALGE
jgi:hypothetical protein